MRRADPGALKHEIRLGFGQFAELYHQLTTLQRNDAGVTATITGQHPELGAVLIVQSFGDVTLRSERPYASTAETSSPSRV